MRLDETLVGEKLEEGVLIEECLGAGGMGVAYRAKQEALSRSLCIKFLRPELVTDRSAFGRFQREAHVLSNLHHPMIITSYFFGLKDDIYPYFAMEYAEGRSLRMVMAEEGRIHWRKSCDYVLQAATALEYAHAKGFVHRDVKPDNMMLISAAEKPTIKLLDFGLAAIVGPQDGSLTATGIVMGSLHYIPPEAVRGIRRDIALAKQGDIYALGCVLHELISGELPFNGGDSQAIMANHLSRTLSPLVDVDASASILKALNKVIQRATAAEPSARYATCTEMIHDLEHVLADGDDTQKRRNKLTDANGSRSVFSIILGNKKLTSLVTLLTLLILPLALPNYRNAVRMVIKESAEAICGTTTSKNIFTRDLTQQNKLSEAMFLTDVRANCWWRTKDPDEQLSIAAMYLDIGQRASALAQNSRVHNCWTSAATGLKNASGITESTAALSTRMQLLPQRLVKLASADIAQLPAEAGPGSSGWQPVLETLASLSANLQKKHFGKSSLLIDGVRLDLLAWQNRYVEALNLLQGRFEDTNPGSQPDDRSVREQTHNLNMLKHFFPEPRQGGHSDHTLYGEPLSAYVDALLSEAEASAANSEFIFDRIRPLLPKVISLPNSANFFTRSAQIFNPLWVKDKSGLVGTTLMDNSWRFANAEKLLLTCIWAGLLEAHNNHPILAEKLVAKPMRSYRNGYWPTLIERTPLANIIQTLVLCGKSKEASDMLNLLERQAQEKKDTARMWVIHTLQLELAVMTNQHNDALRLTQKISTSQELQKLPVRLRQQHFHEFMVELNSIRVDAIIRFDRDNEDLAQSCEAILLDSPSVELPKEYRVGTAVYCLSDYLAGSHSQAASLNAKLAADLCQQSPGMSDLIRLKFLLAHYRSVLNSQDPTIKVLYAEAAQLLQRDAAQQHNDLKDYPVGLYQTWLDAANMREESRGLSNLWAQTYPVHN
jgi:serine/threonine protein kinase